MSSPAAHSKSRSITITQRTALWSWVVTLVTVVVFAAVIIPQQRRVFQENLQSKAHGVAVSLSDLTAGAAVNEDFGTVVDHCMQMLRGDPSLDFIVITKNDGFSLISDRTGWRAENQPGPEWRPSARQQVSSMGIVPLFGRRVFLHSRPLDYSGIQWGWIHVGLSLQAYDRSVTSVYQRTIVLAVICILFSLAASGFYAGRLVRPILHLRNVVQRVASGDLTARAEVAGADELSTLADSVNAMTQALLRRDRILESVRFAAQQFLEAPDWTSVIHPVLMNIGKSAEATAACLFQNQTAEGGRLIAARLSRWTNPGPTPSDGLERADYNSQKFSRWRTTLERGEMLFSPSAQMPEEERKSMDLQGLHSLILIPVHVAGSWWGFLGLEDSARPRIWTEAECSSLRAAADMLGATIARQRTADELLEAKRTLEDRVRDRTRELEQQVIAKEKARADLAEAQSRLIDASRAAGKAEIATSVLHNVGNVLNSVGVSSTIIGQRLRDSKVANLKRAAEMLNQNGNLAAFLTTDPKGKFLPQYFNVLSGELSAEHEEMRAELAQLGSNIEHIKKIVAMQQSYAKVSGATEQVSPVELVEDALRMNATTLNSHQIEIVRQFTPDLPLLNVDRHKVLQILINLLSNAKHALLAGSCPQKRIVLAVRQAGSIMEITIRDNGVGIASENLTRIFQLGFTTKPQGHGFGLHSGANAATELGGRLLAQSAGLGFGAEFTLELPINAKRELTSQS